MCFVAVHMRRSYLGNETSRASKHISFDSSRRVNKNLSSAHRLVEFSTRYRRFSLRMRSNCNSSYCACAVQKLRYLEQISTNLCAVDGFLFYLVETNRMICVSSQCTCAEAISGTKHRPASKHISFDSSRRVNQNLSSAHRLVEFSTRYRRFRLRMRSNCNSSYCACAVRKLRYLEQISTNLCADDRFWFISSRRIE